jgi:uncharacterized metal-binding protein YceD (DUF177 family)
MRYRLTRLMYGPVGDVQNERLDRGSTWFDDDLKVSFLRGEFAFTKTNENILVNGSFETAIDVQCVRSLEIFSLPLTIALDHLVFVPPNRPLNDTDEPDRRISSDGWIDLTATLREEIIMAVPLNPIHPKYAGDAPPALPADLDADTAEWLHVKWRAAPVSKSAPASAEASRGLDLQN